jgi:hypothetical protein
VNSTTVLATFGPGQEVFGSVQVISYSRSSTTLAVTAPAYEIDSSLQSISVPVVITPTLRPDRAVSYTYRYYVAAPAVRSVEPASAPSGGGVQVFVTLKEFPLRQRFSVVFAGFSIPDSDIIVWDASGLTTQISFVTPGTVPGLVPVRVSTKGCANPCRFSVSFNFEQLDMSLPTLLDPIPTAGPYQGAQLIVRLAKFPASGNVDVMFGAMRGSATRMPEASSADVAVLSMAPQPSQGAGATVITVSCNGRAVAFEYTFYDGYGLRMVNAASVPLIPTQASIWGRQVDLASEITVVLSNSPQGLQPSQAVVQVRTSTSAMAPSLAAQVLSIRDVATCSWQRVDCNRTEVRVKMPSMASPGVKAAIISVHGLPSIEWAVEYAPACTGGYDAYCALRGSSMVVDIKRLVDEPTAGCQPNMCVDSNLMRMPQVQSASPSQGPASGGTLVTLQVVDFSCFSAQDLVVSVGQGADRAFATVLSLTPAPGSNLLGGATVITMRTPPATSASWEVTTFTLTSLLGGPASSKSATFAFEFMPVINGPPSVLSFLPSSVLESADLSLAVSLANVPRFSLPFNTSTVYFSINGVSVPQVSKILESSRSQTLFSLVVPGPWTGVPVLNVTVCVLPNCDQVARLEVIVLQPPDPTVSGVFPSSFCSWGSHTFVVTIAYVPPTTTLAQLTAVMYTQGLNTANLNITSLRRLSPASCTIRDCTVFAITLSSPPVNPDGMNADGLANVTIFGATFMVTTSIMYTSSSAATVDMVSPSFQFLGQLNVDPVEIIVNNFPSWSCTRALSCAEEALAQGLEVM